MVLMVVCNFALGFAGGLWGLEEGSCNRRVFRV